MGTRQVTSSSGQRPRPPRVSSDRDGYEPPRIEELGTIEQLTTGAHAPTAADTSSTMGSVTVVCDRRMKHAIEPVEGQTVLDLIGAARRSD